MNRNRLESLSDGVFAIVMTLLVFNIRVNPNGVINITNDLQLILELRQASAAILSYFASFMILGAFWLTNNYLISNYAKNTSRKLVAFNLVFLAFVSIIPFTANLVSTYPWSQLSTVIFGLNLMIISTISLVTFYYILNSRSIENIELSHKRIRYTYLRLGLPLFGSILGIIASFVATEISLVLYFAPVMLNIFPGSLTELDDRVQRLIKEKKGA
jgi:uncharacterized membrane protein